MKPESIDTARCVLSVFAEYIDRHALLVERTGIELAIEVETLIDEADRHDLSLSKLEEEYELKGEGINQLLIKLDPRGVGQVVRMVGGCERVPLTTEIKRKLKLYENLLPSMSQRYDDVAYIDELWLFESKSNIALGCLQWRLGEYLLPGLDMTQLYDGGITFYDWFRHVDRKKNPERKSLWSPMPFIDMFNQWIMHLTSPIYLNRYQKNEEMTGIMGIHFNLDWMLENTILTSAIPMMIVSDDATLVGMNPAAARLIALETFNYDNYSYDNVFEPDAIADKKSFVFQTLNLTHDKPAEVVSFFHKVIAEHQFSHTMFGKQFLVAREYASSLGFYVIALLASGK